MGLQREQALNRLAIDLFPIEALERAIINLPHLLETGEPWEDEQLVDGRYYHYTVFSMDSDMLAVSSEDITERKLVEDALRESEAALSASEGRLRDFLESTHDSFFILDHDWRIQYVNRRFAEIHSIGTEGLFGKGFWEVFPRYLGTPIEQYCRTVMAERLPVHFEYGGIYSPGWYEVSLYPSQDGIAVFAVDRTERKKAQEELQAAYARLKFNVDANIIGVVLGREDGTLIEANDYYLNLIGYTRAEFEAGLINWKNITPPEHLPANYRAIAELKERGICTPFEKEYYRKDGSRVWVYLIQAQLPDGTFAAYVLDISERKRAEKALQLSEEKFARIFKYTPAAMTITRIADMRYTDANESFCQMFGYTREEIVGRSSVELGIFSQEMREEVLRQYGEAGHIHQQEFTVVIKNGSRSQVYFSLDPIEVGGEPSILATMIDITERKRTEEALRKYSEALQEREEILRLALSAGKAGAWSWDLITGTLQWSDEFYRIFGFEPGSITPSAQAGMSHVHPEDRPRIEADLQEAIEQGKQVDEVHRVIWPDGSTHWVRGMSHAFYTPGGRPYRMAGIAIDVTAQKQIEEALRESVVHFSQIADTMPLLAWTARADGILDFINQRYLEYDGIYPVE